MPFKIYKGGSNISEGEREILSSLAEMLANQYNDSSEFCYLFVGFDCGRQIDALLIKSNAIINIEIKDYSGERVISTAQGDLIVEPQQARLSKGRGENPFEQVRQENYAVKNFIFDNQSELFGGKAIATTNDIDVCGYIVLRKIKRVDLSSLSSKKAYFKVTDVDKFQKEISTYRGRDFVKKELSMNLGEDFVKRLAALLDLAPITIEEFSKNIVDDEFDKSLPRYFREIAEKYKPSKEYIDRQSLEGALLNDQNHILTGAPGAGKSWLLRRMVAAHAETALCNNSFEKIPCFLEMLRDGDGDYIEKIALTLMDVPDPDKIKGKLKSGRFWIVFDGVDEMKDFRANLPRVIDFIKLYPNNRYSLSVRREKYNDSEFRIEFEKLRKDKNNIFEEIRVEQFTKDEWYKYIERELPAITPEQKVDFKKFISKLPESNPLTLKMARDIFLDSAYKSNKLVYENVGKFYDAYFKLRLEQECKKGGLGKGANIILGNILTKLGRIFFKKSKGSLTVEDLIDVIRDEGAEEVTRYYGLLLRAEILKPEEEMVKNVERRRNESVQFAHFSYRDFFVAKYMVGKCEDENYRDTFILNHNEHQSIILLCGIEPNPEIVTSIITTILNKRNFNEVILAIECFCNTFYPLPGLLHNISHAIVEESKNDKSFLQLLSYLERFGYFIFTKEIEDYLENESRHNIILKIDWEIFKHKTGWINEVEENIRLTFRHAYRNISGKIIPSYLSDLLFAISKLPAAQNKLGYSLFHKLMESSGWTDIYELGYDKNIDPSIRAYILFDTIDGLGLSPEMSDPKVIIEKLKDLNQLFLYDDELYSWVIVSLFLRDYSDENSLFNVAIQRRFISDFNKYKSPNVQLRIAHALLNLGDMSIILPFIHTILDNKYSTNFLDLDRLSILTSLDHKWFEYFIECNEDSGFILEYALVDFSNETYDTIYKCLALEIMGSLKDVGSKNYLQKFSFSDNEKLKSVAEWSLSQLSK